MIVGRTTYVWRDDQSTWDVICNEKADDLREYRRDKDWTKALPEDCVGSQRMFQVPDPLLQSLHREVAAGEALLPNAV